MREEDTGEMHGIIKRRQKHGLGQPWMKYFRKLGGVDGVIGTRIGVKGQHQG